MTRKSWAVATVAALAAFGLAACGGGSDNNSSTTKAQQSADDGAGDGAAAGDTGEPITVWVDANRTVPAQMWIDAHPEYEITLEVIDATQGTNTSKISLAVKANEGIPDAIFVGSPDEISTLAANPINYPLALNDLVPQDIIDGFPTGALERCSYDGKIYCLANDMGQTVLWYQKPWFEANGYQVPKTFTEFKELGDKIAAEHPGYNMGAVNGRYGVDAFFGSSGCPVIDVQSVTEVKINLDDPKCIRVGDVIGPMLANGTLSNLDLFDKAYSAELVAEGKVVALVGASWVADYAFKPFTTDSGKEFDAIGQYAAAPMPLWDGETTNWSGAVGGGIWIGSARTANPAAVAAFLIGVTTDIEIGRAEATYPAFGPVADAWLSDRAGDTWYAEDPSDVLRDAASKVNPADGYVRYQTELLDSFNATVTKNGATDMAGALKTWGEQAKQAAESTGYSVVQ